MSIEYPARTSVLSPSRVFRLEADTLFVAIRPKSGEPAPAAAIPLREVTAIRLRYHPARFQINRYACRVTTSNGDSFEITNEFAKNLVSIEDRSREYRAFVVALCQRVAAANAAARFLVGRSIAIMVIELAVLALLVAAFGTAAMFVDGHFGWRIVAVLALVAAYVPVLTWSVRKNLPARFDPRAVPERVLPPLARNPVRD